MVRCQPPVARALGGARLLQCHAILISEKSSHATVPLHENWPERRLAINKMMHRRVSALLNKRVAVLPTLPIADVPQTPTDKKEIGRKPTQKNQKKRVHQFLQGTFANQRNRQRGFPCPGSGILHLSTMEPGLERQQRWWPRRGGRAGALFRRKSSLQVDPTPFSGRLDHFGSRIKAVFSIADHERDQKDSYNYY
jgi:hypothetical protein